MSDNSADPGFSGRLVSGEAVELDIRVARLGSRVLALAIDFLLYSGATFVLVLVTRLMLALMLPSGLVDDALDAAVVTIDLTLGFVGVPALVETLSRGRSVGKLAVGLRVVRDDGGPIRFRHALIRALSAFAVEFPGILLPGLTWFACLAIMLVHPSGKRFGDLSAGTIVIHERTPDARIWAPVMPAGLAGWAAVADMTSLDDDLALAIRHFLARNHEISEPARTRLGLALAGELKSFVVPDPPRGTPGWAFLAAVLAERYRRAST
ncbi:MAG TPA: RDD family protein, partial [Stackebrandtia sp.]|uniref:RDD family protein n=1 Tax=Stackebrandtia sp. TaxID=2023065 RepID=UPI002D35AD19